MELIRVFKLILCVIQLVCLYQVLRYDRQQLIPLQLLIAIVSMSI